MTQAQYARHRSQSPQYISKLAKAHVLVMGGRLVDLQASDAGPGVVRPRAQCTGLARCVSGPRLAPKRHANLPTRFRALETAYSRGSPHLDAESLRASRRIATLSDTGVRCQP